MSSSVESKSKMTFGLFEVDLQSGELWKAGKKIKIQSQPFKVLTALLEHPGQVVSREELQLRLWGKNTIVDFDHSLGTAINKIREALGDSADNPRFIQTLARRGYRFIAPVGYSNALPDDFKAPDSSESATLLVDRQSVAKADDVRSSHFLRPRRTTVGRFRYPNSAPISPGDIRRLRRGCDSRYPGCLSATGWLHCQPSSFANDPDYA